MNIDQLCIMSNTEFSYLAYKHSIGTCLVFVVQARWLNNVYNNTVNLVLSTVLYPGMINMHGYVTAYY